MELKQHTILFLSLMGVLAIFLIYFQHYGRIFAILFNVPFLDPDNDQWLKGKFHRWWYSHSLFPGILCTWAFTDILPLELWIYPFIGFCGYSMIHLMGDLGSSKGFGAIKLWPIHKTINSRLWIGIQLILFIALTIILLW